MTDGRGGAVIGTCSVAVRAELPGDTLPCSDSAGRLLAGQRAPSRHVTLRWLASGYSRCPLLSVPSITGHVATPTPLRVSRPCREKDAWTHPRTLTPPDSRAPATT
ncbi:hypothetical protein AAFF_G00092550 [Aldrovandia affinis]|uniref:Uncharacterized protein n=1 Tax=Aldrovandia affinis TaxID=143900 RepID=A0AAD7T2L2_9TELE|nr:hypothetical protein AAFF_G00092550 [Aldrovandia affinis]